MSDRKTDGPDAVSISEDQPTTWFETLYAKSSTQGDGVPWANMTTHPSFAKWLDRHAPKGDGQRALVVGCGMGDDAVTLEALGFEVTAFDVAASAIDLCKQRFPGTSVTFQQADLLEPQPQWHHAFDFVLEIFTIQALPPKYEAALIDSIAGFVAPGGQLVVVAETSDAARDFERGPPWLLTPSHIEAFQTHGLHIEERVSEASGFERADNLLTTTFRRPD